MSHAHDAEIIDVGSSMTIGSIETLRSGLLACLAGRRPVRLQAGSLEQADVTFVQVLVSASRTFQVHGLAFGLIGASECVRRACERAGLPTLSAELSPTA